MLLNSTDATNVQYYIRLASGQEIGPYGSYEQASMSAATMPVVEGVAPSVFPKTSGGQQVLFG
jgi:hypothetical protein